jgi:glycosyltransferase involved in cell wall biosynthesis
MTPRRVAIVVLSMAMGGMEAHALELAKELARRGSHVRLVIPSHAEFDDLAAAALNGSVRAWRLDTTTLRGRGAEVRNLMTLAWRLAAWRPDVVHIHTGKAAGGLAVVLLARLVSRAVVVLTEHDAPAPTPSRHQLISRAIVDRSIHALVAVSRHNAALRMSRLGGGPRQFATVLNGVPLPDGDASSVLSDRLRIRRRLNIPEDSFVVGCSARLVEGKGLAVLLRAFAMLPAALDTRLLLVGDGPLRADLERLADELKIVHRIVFAGYQPQPAPYLNAMDMFALAVPAGSMSIALLEAMARGLPAVITYGGPDEPVIPGRTGLKAPPNDPEALSIAINKLARDRRLAAEMGTAAAAHIRRHFTAERVADDLLEVYGAGTWHLLPERLRVDSPAARTGDRPLLSEARIDARPGAVD